MATFLKATSTEGGERFVNTETIRSIYAGEKDVWIEAFGGAYTIASDNPVELAEGLAVTVATADSHGSVLQVTDLGRVSESKAPNFHSDVWIPSEVSKAA